MAKKETKVKIENVKEKVEPIKSIDLEIPGKSIPGIKEEIDSKIIDGDTMGSIVAVVFSKLSESKGEHWKLKEDEKKTIGTLGANVLNRYAGELFKEVPEIAALIIGCTVILAPRFSEDSKVKKKNDTQNKDTGGEARQLANRTNKTHGDRQNTSIRSDIDVQKQDIKKSEQRSTNSVKVGKVLHSKAAKNSKRGRKT